MGFSMLPIFVTCFKCLTADGAFIRFTPYEPFRGQENSDGRNPLDTSFYTVSQLYEQACVNEVIETRADFCHMSHICNVSH